MGCICTLHGLRQDAGGEERRREEGARPQRARVPSDAPDPDREEGHHDGHYSDEPREQLSGERELRERPPAFVDERCHGGSLELSRVGWHRETARWAEPKQ